MNILQLRTEVEALLGDELGTYTLPNGEVTPSISVRSEGEDLPARTSVDGLEVVLLRDPELAPIPQYADTGALRLWTVLLVAWNDLADIQLASAKLISTYGSRVSTIPVTRDVGPLRQVRIVITTPSIPVDQIPVTPGYILLENGAPMLLETGGYILLED